VIRIPAEILDEMIAHAVAGLPNEACGLLGGVDGRAERFFPTGNADQSAKTYSIDSKELHRALAEIEKAGLEHLGIFHSHTHTEAYPSFTDIKRAHWDGSPALEQQPTYPGVAYVIASLKNADNPDVRAFEFVQRQPIEQEVRIT